MYRMSLCICMCVCVFSLVPKTRMAYLGNEVMLGQNRMWEIKGRIKAAYKYNKPEFHRVSACLPAERVDTRVLWKTRCQVLAVVVDAQVSLPQEAWVVVNTHGHKQGARRNNTSINKFHTYIQVYTAQRKWLEGTKIKTTISIHLTAVCS